MWVGGGAGRAATSWTSSRLCTSRQRKVSAVPFSQFLDRVMDIPVAVAALVSAVHNCAEDRGASCGVPALFHDKLQQSRICVEGASASVHILHARHPCCAAQCKLCSRLQRSHRCVCSSWLGLTCPLLRNDWRWGAGSACSSGVPVAALWRWERRLVGGGRRRLPVLAGVGAHHTGDELMLIGLSDLHRRDVAVDIHTHLRQRLYETKTTTQAQTGLLFLLCKSNH